MKAIVFALFVAAVSAGPIRNGESHPTFVCPEKDIAATKCKGPKDCLYPNPDSCTSFIHCEVNADDQTGRPTIQDCPANLEWNDNKKECDYEENSTCNGESATDGPATDATTTQEPEGTTGDASSEQPTTAEPTTQEPDGTTDGSDSSDDPSTHASTSEPSTAEPSTTEGESETTTEQPTTESSEETTTDESTTTSAPEETTTTDQSTTTEQDDDETTTEEPSSTTTQQTTEQTSTAQPSSTNQPTTESSSIRPSTLEPSTSESTSEPTSSTTESSGGSTEFVCPESDIAATQCMGPKDCLYPYDKDCSKFIHCEVNADGRTGRPTIKDCPGGLEWNDSKKECDWPSSATCANRR